MTARPTSNGATETIKWLIGICLVAIYIVLNTSLLTAPAAAIGLIEGYNYPNASSIVPGMMVSSVSSKSTEVTLTTKKNVDRVIGVVATEGSGLLALTTQASNIYVADSGTVPAFVTDANGAVTSGDYLSISSVAGVLAKSTKDDPQVLGIASEAFDATKAQKTTVSLSNGKTASISVGLVTMQVKSFTNPEHQESQGFFKTIGARVVGKAVTNTQVALAGALMILAVGTIFTLMNAAVRTAVTAIGRNPMAKRSVLHSLLQLVTLSIAVLLAGVIGAYVVLWI